MRYGLEMMSEQFFLCWGNDKTHKEILQKICCIVYIYLYQNDAINVVEFTIYYSDIFLKITINDNHPIESGVSHNLLKNCTPP